MVVRIGPSDCVTLTRRAENDRPSRRVSTSNSKSWRISPAAMKYPCTEWGSRLGETVFDAAISDCAITCPPYTRPVGKYRLSPLM